MFLLFTNGDTVVLVFVFFVSCVLVAVVCFLTLVMSHPPDAGRPGTVHNVSIKLQSWSHTLSIFSTLIW